ncbi:MAG TPA: FAD-dependent monooxygenase [Streptosporangiaceae bacterium]|nr:FAD-dependent monooxygenase [Streptosporangiaceae bacterium]
MTSAEDHEILVIGGGIGGLAAALAISRTGRHVRVLERSRQFGEIGAGIQLAPNATRILDRLGLVGRACSVGVLPRRLVLADAVDGRELTALDLTDFPDRYGAPYIVLHRSDLLDILLQGCTDAGVGLEAAADVTELRDDGASVHVTCADGRAFHGVAAIGADGLRSRSRTLFSDDQAICSGYVAYRGAVPTEQVERHADGRDVVAWIGPGLHFVQYPLRRGQMYNQVAVFRSDAFRRGEADWGTPAELDQRFSACCGHVQESIRLLGRDNRWPMQDRLPIPTWAKGRIALLGDAAHPMLQYLAQGGCQAIEDASALAAALERHCCRPPTGANVEAALLAYQQVRAPRTARVQRAARTWGEIWHLDGAGKLVRDELFRQRRDDDHTHVRWLYARGADSLPWADDGEQASTRQG